MKIRNGFVSNSSSSSFVAVVKRVNKINPEDIGKKRFVFFGRYLYEGMDLVEIKDMYMFYFWKLAQLGIISADISPNLYEIIEEDESSINLDSKLIQKLDPDSKYDIISDTVDQHCSTTLERLFNNYWKDEDSIINSDEMDEKEMQKSIEQLYQSSLRNKKLKRVVK